MISFATKSEPGGRSHSHSTSVAHAPEPLAGTASHGDHELVRRVARGEGAALERLVRAHWKPVVRYADYLLGDLDAAEDVVQEAFVRLWANSAEWRPRGCVRAFLYRVTRNLALNERRRERVRTLWASRAGPELQWSGTPTQALEAQEIRVALQKAMAALPERRREVFWLARYQQMSHREIAQMMGISVQTVANQMTAALATLRQRLRPYLDQADATADAGDARAG